MKALGPLLSKSRHVHAYSQQLHTQKNNKYFEQLLDPAIENIHLSFCLYFLLAA